MSWLSSTSTFDAVLFDLDGTLHDNNGAFRAAAHGVARDFAAEHAIDAELFWRSYLEQGDRATLDVADIRAYMMGAALRAVGIGDAALARRVAEAYEAYHRSGLALFPGALDLLASLRARGIKVGLVTNGFAGTHRERIAFLGLDRSLDGAFFADDVGAYKPDPRIFLHACERLGARPERAIMVGDRWDCDIVGGRAAGLRVVWMNVCGELLPSDASHPDAIVRTVVELAALFAPVRGREVIS